MQAKHYSLVFSVILIAMILYSIAWLAFFYQKDVYPSIKFSSNQISPALYNLSVPEKDLQLIAKDVFINASDENDINSSTDLSAFGYNPVSAGRPASKKHNHQREYDVSMSIAFKDNKYCVVNNKFYREGDFIADNIFIKAIQKKRILIDEYGKSKWHDVTNGISNNKEIKNESVVLSAR